MRKNDVLRHLCTLMIIRCLYLLVLDLSVAQMVTASSENAELSSDQTLSLFLETLRSGNITLPKNEVELLKGDSSPCKSHAKSFDCCNDSLCALCEYGTLQKLLARIHGSDAQTPLSFSGMECIASASDCQKDKNGALIYAAAMALKQDVGIIKGILKAQGWTVENKYESGKCPPNYQNLPPIPKQPVPTGAMPKLSLAVTTSAILWTLT